MRKDSQRVRICHHVSLEIFTVNKSLVPIYLLQHEDPTEWLRAKRGEWDAVDKSPLEGVITTAALQGEIG